MVRKMRPTMGESSTTRRGFSTPFGPSRSSMERIAVVCVKNESSPDLQGLDHGVQLYRNGQVDSLVIVQVAARVVAVPTKGGSVPVESCKPELVAEYERRVRVESLLVLEQLKKQYCDEWQVPTRLEFIYGKVKEVLVDCTRRLGVCKIILGGPPVREGLFRSWGSGALVKHCQANGARDCEVVHVSKDGTVALYQPKGYMAYSWGSAPSLRAHGSGMEDEGSPSWQANGMDSRKWGNRLSGSFPGGSAATSSTGQGSARGMSTQSSSISASGRLQQELSSPQAKAEQSLQQPGQHLSESPGAASLSQKLFWMEPVVHPVESLADVNGYSVGSNGSASSGVSSVVLSPVHSDPGTRRKVGMLQADAKLNLSGPMGLSVQSMDAQYEHGAQNVVMGASLSAKESDHSLVHAIGSRTLHNNSGPLSRYHSASSLHDGPEAHQRCNSMEDTQAPASSEDVPTADSPRNSFSMVDTVMRDSTALKGRVDIMERMKANNRELSQQIVEMRKKMSELESTVQMKHQRQEEMEWEMHEMEVKLQSLEMENQTSVRRLKQEEELRNIIQNKIDRTQEAAKQKEMHVEMIQERFKEQEVVIACLREQLLAAELRKEESENSATANMEAATKVKTELCAAQLKLQQTEERCALLEGQLDAKEGILNRLAKRCGELQQELNATIHQNVMLADTIKSLQQEQQNQRIRYREYKFSDLEEATNHFAEDRKKGEGGYGTVYLGHINHTPVAVKLLSATGLQGQEEFAKEVMVLSQIRHPHMVALLGACPEKFCLVYEYMANGSLDDMLQCAGGLPPLQWHVRIRIAAETAQGLLHLHSNLPEPIIHRDLKPANILLDHNLVSKIGDVGLAKLAPCLAPDAHGPRSRVTHLLESTPKGTYAYIDPEYNRTGRLGLKSDLYALGIIMLQLLSGKNPQDACNSIIDAMEDGDLSRSLDTSAGDWSLSIAKELAELALACASMQRKDRPDLDRHVLPKLFELQAAAEQVVENDRQQHPHLVNTLPDAFICPITQELMEDPVVAADGHTYERTVIEKWFETHQTSPMTNLWLASKVLVPNHAVRSALQEWKIKMEKNDHLMDQSPT